MATHCYILLHTATHCNTLQHTATHCYILLHTAKTRNHKKIMPTWNSYTLQHPATSCHTLQHTATPCHTLQHTLYNTCCNTRKEFLPGVVHACQGGCTHMCVCACVCVRLCMCVCVYVCVCASTYARRRKCCGQNKIFKKSALELFDMLNKMARGLSNRHYT